MIQLELPFPTCQIQWIDQKGNPTPDNNYSVGMATCYNDLPRRSFHICKKHAKRMESFPNWSFTPIK